MKWRGALPPKINTADAVALYTAEAREAVLTVDHRHLLAAYMHLTRAFSWAQTVDGALYWIGVFDRMSAMLTGAHTLHKLSPSSNGCKVAVLAGCLARTPLPLSTETGGSTPPGDTSLTEFEK